MSKLVHMLSAAGVLAVAAGAAYAEKDGSSLLLGQAPAIDSKNTGAEGAYFRTGQIANFNVAGISSGDAIGTPTNTVVNMNLGAGASVTGISWDVVIEAFSPSWQSEVAVTFSDSAGLQGITLRVGAGTNTSGQGAFASGGVVKFADVPLPDIFLADGILRMEFHESYDDPSISPDGMWHSGTLGIQFVPAPSAVALLGLGGLAAARRRRA